MEQHQDRLLVPQCSVSGAFPKGRRSRKGDLACCRQTKHDVLALTVPFASGLYGRLQTLGFDALFLQAPSRHPHQEQT